MDIKPIGTPYSKQIILGLIVTLSACTTVNFKEPITSYSSAMSESSSVFNDYYAQQNELARRSYFTQLKYHRERYIQVRDESGRHSSLYFKYSPEGIKARRDALSLISEYGNRLAVMAGADSPQRISDSSGNILSSYRGLSEAFGRLTGDEAKYKVSYAEGTEKLTSALTKMYAEHIQNEALMAAIKDGHAAVELILLTLQSDLKDLSATNQARFHTQLSDLVSIYNGDVDARKNGQDKPVKGSLGQNSQVASQTLAEPQRLELLNQTQTSAGLYEGSVMNRPDDVVAAMLQANNDLYAYAINPKGDNALIALNSSLETFNARIKPFVDYYSANKNRS
ncbi:hypothetical protein D3C84_329670 [compost metagenome]